MTAADTQQPTITPARLEAFSDGVIAIAATLLVLDIHAPLTQKPVWSTLGHEWPALAAYAISFLIIGIAWIHHHNLFHQVRHVDRTLLFLNLGMLMTISFLPVPTATLGNHLTSDHAVEAAVFYAASLATASLWFTLLWNHLYAQPHLLHTAARRAVGSSRRHSLLGPVSYLAATLVALLSPVASLVMIGVVVLYFIVGRRAPASLTRWSTSS
jgi:uncharacterized membrane protein